jgi:hypothetical protein
MQLSTLGVFFSMIVWVSSYTAFVFDGGGMGECVCAQWCCWMVMARKGTCVCVCVCVCVRVCVCVWWGGGYVTAHYMQYGAYPVPGRIRIN